MGNKKFIQFLAHKFMQSIGPCYPVNLHRIARQINSDICYRHDMPRTVNGATIPLRNGSYIITIKSHQPLFNERFSVAREIAHIVLGHCTDEIVVTSSAEVHNFGIFRYDMESYTFAMEMLVPMDELKCSLSAFEVLDIDRLCTLYGVGGDVIKTRLNELGSIRFNQTLPHTLSLSNCSAMQDHLI